ncbi:MAG TPA: hypothetical protein VFJ16_27470 [Longimicrobium sp.]|nr:hypothetical protein [Longimicrobium sp.]
MTETALLPTRAAPGDRLFALLPAVHRARDEEAGGPLRALLAALDDQVAVLEEGMEQLYDDLFVETCAPWVLPYIADLLGVGSLPSEQLDARGEVANTIAFRRRKGTAAMLEQMARDVSGLPARAVEHFQALAVTQHLNHVRPDAPAFASLRGASRLERAGTAFESLPRSAEVRRPARGGRYNVPNVGVFLWRLRAYRLGRTPAVPANDTGADPARCFRFDPMGRDLPLFHRPHTEEDLAHLAEPVNVPLRISRRALLGAPEDYYGTDRSFFLEIPVPDQDPEAVDPGDIIAADLSEWGIPSAGKVAVDPVLGRVSFGTAPARRPLATFHYGFSGDLGGGEYSRPTALAGSDGPVAIVSALGRVPDAFKTLGAALASLPGDGGVIEIADNARYPEDLLVTEPRRRLVIRAADGVRPVVGGRISLVGGPEDSATLDGVVIEGRVSAAAAGGYEGPGRLILRHCTIVPGADRLCVADAGTRLEIDHSIVGGIGVHLDASARITDSVVDSGGETSVAYADPAGKGHGAPLQCERCTVIGRIKSDALELVSNSILLSGRSGAEDPAEWPAAIVARRRQEGCVRYSYVPLDALVPRRYRCHPDGPKSAGAAPAFTSLTWGDAGYAQLAPHAPVEIRRGADDESEMGAFHHLYLPLREAHLRQRLDEALRFGQEAGLVYAS